MKNIILLPFRIILVLLKISAIIIWFIISGSFTIPFIGQSKKNLLAVSKITSIWGQGLTYILNLKIKVQGELENLSKLKGVLIVSNHLGYMDIPAHSAVFPIRFAPKIEIKHWPFLGWFIDFSAKPVWVDRKSKYKATETLEEFKKTLNYGIPLIVYPEGTSTDGKKLLPFKSTPFEAAARSGCTILPVLTHYCDPTVCWYGEMTMLPHILKMLGKWSIDVELYILQPFKSSDRTRKQLAKELHRIMEKKHNEIIEKKKEHIK